MNFFRNSGVQCVVIDREPEPVDSPPNSDIHPLAAQHVEKRIRWKPCNPMEEEIYQLALQSAEQSLSGKGVNKTDESGRQNPENVKDARHCRRCIPHCVTQWPILTPRQMTCQDRLDGSGLDIKILRIANSSFFGFSGRIENIQRAIVILGFNEVRNLIMASSVMNMFSRKESSTGFNQLTSGAFAGRRLDRRSVARLAGCPIVENFFVAGILHDIGKLFFTNSPKTTSHGSSLPSKRGAPHPRL